MHYDSLWFSFWPSVQLARVKKKIIIRVIVVLVLLGIVGRFCLIMALAPTDHKSLQSPDKQFFINISSQWRGDFWGGAAHDRFDIRVKSVKTKRVHSMVIDDRSDGWPQACSAQWAPDNSSVTLVFKHDEMESMRMVLAVYE